MYQEQSYSQAPRYENILCRHIGVLQQVQMLLSDDATLEDVVQLIYGLQREFGMQERLEHVIQFLVSRALQEQISQREEKLQSSSSVPS